MRISKQNFPILITILLHFLMYQNNYSQMSISLVIDSTLIRKPVVMKFNVTSNSTGEGIEGVGINPKSPDGTHFGAYYITQGAIYTDENGNAWKDMKLPAWDRITTDISDYLGFDIPTIPDKFFVGAYPNPFNPETNVVFNAKKSGKYTYQLVDLDGSLIATNSADLKVGNYGMKVNTGASGVDFMRIIGPDGTVSSVKLVNLGGGYAPSVGKITGYSGDLSKFEKKQPASSKNSFNKSGTSNIIADYGDPVDTIQVSYGKAGIGGNAFYGVYFYGVEELDTAKVARTFPGDANYRQNIFKPGVENIFVDTVETYTNSVDSLGASFWNNPKFRGRVLIHNQPGGFPADSLEYFLGLDTQ